MPHLDVPSDTTLGWDEENAAAMPWGFQAEETHVKDVGHSRRGDGVRHWTGRDMAAESGASGSVCQGFFLTFDL